MAEKEISLDSVAPVEKKLTPTTSATPATPENAEQTGSVVDLIINQSMDELLPWEECTLPSMGVYYNGKIPNGKVKVRPMGLYTDKIFATTRLAQSGQALDHVYKKCIQFPDKNFDPQDLLVGDRTFLLFYLRGITHGNIYEFALTCPNEDCKATKFYEYDLNLVGQTIRRPTYPAEPIKVVLPYFTKKFGREVYVEVRYSRGRDLQVMMQHKRITDSMAGSQNVRSKSGKTMSGPSKVIIDEAVEDNLNLLVESVNGERDRGKIKEFISRLQGRDTAAIRSVLDDTAPGIDTDIIITCSACGREINTDLPITDTFFRPKDSGTV